MLWRATQPQRAMASSHHLPALCARPSGVPRHAARSLGVLERIARLLPVCNGVNCVAWCYYHNKHWYSNNHQGGGNLIFADGHARYRTLFSIHSGDFGLTPDRVQNPTDNKGCDPGLKRAF
jgi:prepilin-type processing-associated H-X9-DG protein